MECTSVKDGGTIGVFTFSNTSLNLLNESDFNQVPTVKQNDASPQGFKSEDNQDPIYTYMEKLNSYKHQLNDVKCQTGKYEGMDWRTYTTSRHPGQLVNLKIRQLLPDIFITQAWLKFYEILSTFNLVDGKLKELNAVHLCEAPGGFVSALDQYISSSSNAIKYNYIASSLNPYYNGNCISEMIADDRYMFQNLQNWYFGEDDTGNILVEENSKGIIAKARAEMHSIQLVTADGSIDCQGDPANQEEIVAPIIFSEAVTSLSMLLETNSKGGHYVFKMFTMFERSSIELLYLLNRCFKSVSVFKPLTSKAGNSEVYVICLHFLHNLSGFMVDRLNGIYRYVNEKKSCQDVSIFKTVEVSFLKQIEECCLMFNNRQMQTIKDNIYYFDKTDAKIDSYRNGLTEYYLKKCGFVQNINNITEYSKNSDEKLNQTDESIVNINQASIVKIQLKKDPNQMESVKLGQLLNQDYQTNHNFLGKPKLNQNQQYQTKRYQNRKRKFKPNIKNEQKFHRNKVSLNDINLVIGKKYNKINYNSYLPNNLIDNPEFWFFSRTNAVLSICNAESTRLVDDFNYLSKPVCEYTKTCFFKIYDTLKLEKNVKTNCLVLFNLIPIDYFIANVIFILTCACETFDVIFDEGIIILNDFDYDCVALEVFDRVYDQFIRLDKEGSDKTITRFLQPKVFLHNSYTGILHRIMNKG